MTFTYVTYCVKTVSLPPLTHRIDTVSAKGESVLLKRWLFPIGFLNERFHVYSKKVPLPFGGAHCAVPYLLRSPLCPHVAQTGLSASAKQRRQLRGLYSVEFLAVSGFKLRHSRILLLFQHGKPLKSEKSHYPARRCGSSFPRIRYGFPSGTMGYTWFGFDDISIFPISLTPSKKFYARNEKCDLPSFCFHSPRVG